MENEKNAEAETSWADEPVAADEIARAELAKERQQNEAAPVENLTGTSEPEVDIDAQSRVELFGVLSQSVSGNHLTQRDVERAQAAAFEFEKLNPQMSEAWANYARSSADRLGFVMNALASGTLPSGPPERHADELAAVDQKHRALRELAAMPKPGTDEYRQQQPRIQALYALAYGDTPLVGRSGRRA